MFEYRSIGTAFAILTIGTCLSPAPVAAQAPERFQGILSSTVLGASGLAQIRIQIEEYTTDAETREFIDILANEGWRALESKFLREEKGRFIRSGQPGHNIAFARSLPHETGRIIRLATARPILFGEASRATRSREYAFGIIELRLDEEGKGSGIVIGAAKLEFDDDGQLDIESYGHPPLSITTIEVQD